MNFFLSQNLRRWLFSTACLTLTVLSLPTDGMANQLVKQQSITVEDRIDFKRTLQKALSGDTYAQATIGDMYFDGQGVEKNPQKGLEWFHRAASHDESLALVGLGNLYVMGKFVPQDYTKAFQYYEHAAELGDSFGRLKLAQMYRDGKGTAQDYVQAYRWFNISCLNEGEKARDMLSALMTVEQIHEAQRQSCCAPQRIANQQACKIVSKQ